MKLAKKSSITSLAGEIENETYWKNHKESLKTSNLSRKEYCRLHQVNYDRFGYWINKSMNKPQPLVAICFCNSA